MTNTDVRDANVHHAYLGIPHIDLVDLSTTRRAHRAGVPVLSHLWRLVQTRLVQRTHAADAPVVPATPL